MCEADFVGMTAEAAVILFFSSFVVHVTGITVYMFADIIL